jgi:hypothetical protein
MKTLSPLILLLFPPLQLNHSAQEGVSTPAVVSSLDHCVKTEQFPRSKQVIRRKSRDERDQRQWLMNWYLWIVCTLFSVCSIGALDSTVTDRGTPSSSTAPLIVERDAHQQRWEYLSYRDNEDGTRTVRTNWFMELCTGLNRWSADQNAWVPASAEIEIVNGQGLVRNAQWSAIISGNANDPGGAVDLLTPDKTRVVFQTVGLAYTDDEGRSAFIAELQSSEGQLIDKQTIIYPDALAGDGVRADLRVRSSLAGLENDVVLRQALPAPELLGFDPAKTYLEAWHEIINRAKPLTESGGIRRFDDAVDSDVLLRFGEMLIGQGNAFNLGLEFPDGPVGEQQSIPLADAVAVAKEYAEIDGMAFLIERMPFAEAEPFLKRLPEPAQAFKVDKEQLERSFADRSNAKSRLRPLSITGITSDHKKATRQVAALTSGMLKPAPGFLIDFAALITSTNFTFDGATTYYVSGDVNLSGLTTIEGGSVTKFSNNAPSITMTGTLLCKTTPWLPAVFTAKDANDVGEIITGSSGNPTATYALRPLKFYNANPVQSCGMHDLRIAYAQNAVSVFSGYDNDLRNLQVVKCLIGVELAYSYARVRNVLIQDASNHALSGNNAKFTAEHLTIHNAGNLYYNASSSFYLTNSLLVAVTNIGSYTGSNNQQLSSDSGVFASVAHGAHYLVSDTYRNSGSTQISYLQEIRKMTTYPPIVLTGALPAETTLFPNVQRDWDAAPDLGYHYAPLDYVLSNATLSASSTLICTNGVKVGYCGDRGLSFVGSGGVFISEGRPEELNRLVRTETVQEQPVLSGLDGVFANFSGATTSPVFTLRHSGASALAPARILLTAVGSTSGLQVTYAHSGFSTMYINCIGSSDTPAYYGLTNNVFERSTVLFDKIGRSSFPIIDAFNNSVIKGELYVFSEAGTASIWTFKDNLFYPNSLTVDTPNSVVASNNAYKNGMPSLGGSSNIIYSADFIPGPLGPYYYPSTGTNLNTLVNAGSRSADSASLYHYTVRQDQVKETNSTVDIGMHYAALSTPKVRFIGTDDTTQGNWPGIYGVDGYSILQFSQRTPPDYSDSVSGATGTTWASNPTDQQSLQRGDGTGRIAACWYSTNYFELAFTQTEGAPRRFAVYVLDYDNGGRAETLEIRDTATGSVLDSRTASSFGGGRYYIWEIVGGATLRVTRTAGSNAVISGYFLDPGGSIAPTDQDQDGISDVSEDRNGNGTLDSAETSYASAHDLGLKVRITQPKSVSNLP